MEHRQHFPLPDPGCRSPYKIFFSRSCTFCTVDFQFCSSCLYYSFIFILKILTSLNYVQFLYYLFLQLSLAKSLSKLSSSFPSPGDKLMFVFLRSSALKADFLALMDGVTAPLCASVCLSVPKAMRELAQGSRTVSITSSATVTAKQIFPTPYHSLG